MLEIERDDDGRVTLAGRFDASQVEGAQRVFDGLEPGTGPQDVDFSGLEYISSAGLGVLLKTQKRLMARGVGLRFVNVSPHIRDVFRYSGFDSIFEIDEGSRG